MGHPSASRRKFEDDAVAGGAAEDGAAVEVALLVEHEIACRCAAVVAGKSVQNGVLPLTFRLGGELVDHAAARRVAAAVRGAVQVARLIHNHASVWEMATRSAFEVVQDGLFP